MTRKLSLIILLLTSLFFSQKSYAQTYDNKENAVYIYNFIRYTKLASKNSVIEVGVVGNTPAEEELRVLFSKKKSSTLSYNLRKITADQASKCDVVFVSAESSGQLKAINEATRNLPILIITEKANMGRFGACISFFINEDDNYKTEYQVSIKNCRERGLNIGEQIKNNGELMR
jgi:hypothetical protein